jgi:16S rRNA (guanine527-N7)-methyltransferase
MSDTDAISNLEPLVDLARRHDLPLDDSARERYATYLELLQHFNDSMNLIGPLDEAGIVRELLVDSLAPAVLASPSGTMLDVGSGAGLPGLPLKILYPDHPVVLVEPRRKRATFLKIARNRLELEDVRIERSRIERLPDERFDYVVSKAFRSPPEWLEIAERRLADSGRLVCMTNVTHVDDLRETARRLDLSIVASVDDTSELGAPALDPPRSLYVLER